jgi:hypothetical protein
MLAQFMTRLELTTYLDTLEINSDNIGDVPRQLMMPFDCEWNAWVRDETATRENSRERNYPLARRLADDVARLKREAGQFKIQLQNLEEQRDTARGLYDAATRERDHYKLLVDAWKVGDLAKEKEHYKAVAQKATDECGRLEQQLDAVKIQRDAAEARTEGLRRQLNSLDMRALFLSASHADRRDLVMRAIERATRMSFQNHKKWVELSAPQALWVVDFFLIILSILPQLDVPNHHPVGASTPGNRNCLHGHSSADSKSENGQTSIASEVIPGSSVPGLPA